MQTYEAGRTANALAERIFVSAISDVVQGVGETDEAFEETIEAIAINSVHAAELFFVARTAFIKNKAEEARLAKADAANESTEDAESEKELANA